MLIAKYKFSSTASNNSTQHCTITSHHSTAKHSSLQIATHRGLRLLLGSADVLSVCVYRHNQALEQDTVCMQAEKLRLEHEAHTLSQTLNAVMNDKFEIHRTEFDAETPIDKVLNMMHDLITKVRMPPNTAIIFVCSATHQAFCKLHFAVCDKPCEDTQDDYICLRAPSSGLPSGWSASNRADDQPVQAAERVRHTPAAACGSGAAAAEGPTHGL